jgi:hypothetical protein
MPTWAILAFALIPHDVVLTDSVDMVEMNHFVVNRNTGATKCAFVFWEWDVDTYRVVDWRWFNGHRPWRRGNRWVLFLREKDGLRRILSRQVRETWTTYDVEVEERKRHPSRRLLCPFLLKPLK